MNFKIGQKIVCIEDNFPRFRLLGIIVPRRKSIYTVRGFVPSNDGGVLILLEEINNEHFTHLTRSKQEPGFYPYHFAPATYRTDETSEISSKVLEECPVVEEVLDAIMEDEEILKYK